MRNKKEINEIKEKKKRKIGPLFIIRALLIIAILIMIPVVGYEGYKYKVQLDIQNSIPKRTVEESDAIVKKEMAKLKEIDDAKDWPKDELFVTKERKEYTKDKTLRLVIPKIKVDTIVRNGTTSDVLALGAGLYTFAQMPGEGDRNTSIAGHRTGLGTSWNIFYDVDKIAKGDEMYLIYEGKVYDYTYKETKIVTPDDVSVVTLQGYPCLTLTSCHPIGDNKERIIVHGELKEIKDIKDTEFAES